MPFLALGLKVLYPRSGILYLDHLVFALHFQSALFFTLAGAWILTRLLRLGLTASLVLYAGTGFSILTIYLGLALRRRYGQAWWATGLKTVAVIFVYSRLLTYAVGLAAFVAMWQI